MVIVICVCVLTVYLLLGKFTEILPSQPLNVQAVAVSPTAINLTWAPPRENQHTVHEYVVNITTLRSFDAPYTGLGYGVGGGSTTSAPASTSNSPAGNNSSSGESSLPFLIHVSLIYCMALCMHGKNLQNFKIQCSKQYKRMESNQVNSSLPFSFDSTLYRNNYSSHNFLSSCQF